MILKNIWKKLQNNLTAIIIFLSSFIIGIGLFYLFGWEYKTDDNFILTNKTNQLIQKFENSKLVKSRKLTRQQKDDLIISGLFYHLNKKYDDIHSTYFNKEMLDSFNQSLNSEFVGIGIQSQQNEQGLVVKRVFDNTPAKKTGIVEQDLILGTNKIDFSKQKDISFVEYIKGEPNSNVTLKILRNGKILSLNVQRQQLNLPQVSVSKYNNNSVLYINISSFGENVGTEFTDKLKQSFDSKTKKIIIDVRSNGGGSLQEVEKIISLFVKKNTKILQRKTIKQQTYDYSSENKKTYLNIPLAILIDSQSASASEILAISLKETANAKLYGTKSFGKGSVQRMYNIDENSAFKMTIEKWFSPKGVGIDKVGIKPNVELTNDKSWYQLPYSKLAENDKVLKYVLGENNE